VQVVLTVLGFLLQFSFVIFTVFSNMSTNQQRFSEDAPQPSDFVKACPIPRPWLQLLLDTVAPLQHVIGNLMDSKLASYSSVMKQCKRASHMFGLHCYRP